MSTTQHPLTETAAAELWGKHVGDTVPWGDWYGGSRRALTSLLRAAFDAGREHETICALREHVARLEAEVTAARTDRPWKPLNGPVRVGDEVRQELRGGTTIAVVGRVDVEGDPWTDEDRFIGVLDEGTWYVRRTVQELPTEAEEIIVARSEDVDIEAVMDGDTWRAREAILGRDRRWFAVWRSGNRARLFASPEDITPGTWKVDEQ